MRNLWNHTLPSCAPSEPSQDDSFKLQGRQLTFLISVGDVNETSKAQSQEHGYRNRFTLDLLSTMRSGPESGQINKILKRIGPELVQFIRPGVPTGIDFEELTPSCLQA